MAFDGDFGTTKAFIATRLRPNKKLSVVMATLADGNPNKDATALLRRPRELLAVTLTLTTQPDRSLFELLLVPSSIWTRVA